MNGNKIPETCFILQRQRAITFSREARIEIGGLELCTPRSPE
jgi:hypothetical protein